MTLTKIEPQNLRTPGPTPIPDDIVEEMSLPMINHRGPEFKELIEATTAGLKQVFMTTNDLYILTSSGTGALEAAVVNTLSPGDKVIAATAGSFGDRFVQIAEGYGADVTRMDFEWGDAIDPDAIRAQLQKDPAIKAVLVTHNETSTGVTHDLESIARVVKGEFDKLLLVDAVSSLGCIPLPVDGWNCDLVATGSQKGFMIPPGLAFISISARGWEAYQDAKMPRFYFDLMAAERSLVRGQTPWTPNVALLYGLRLGLDRILNEGLENGVRASRFRRRVLPRRRQGPGSPTARQRRVPRFQHRHRCEDARGNRRRQVHGDDARRRGRGAGWRTGQAHRPLLPCRTPRLGHEGRHNRGVGSAGTGAA